MSLDKRAAQWKEKLQLPTLSAWLIRQICKEREATYLKPQIEYCSKADKDGKLMNS